MSRRTPRTLRLSVLAVVALAACTILPLPRAACADPVGGGPADAAGLDQAAIDEAIRKGAEWLKNGFQPGDNSPTTELVLLTLLHAGGSLSDPAVSGALEYVKKLDVTKLTFREKVYRVSLAAMCLEHVNRDAFVDRLATFAKFLVCNQCVNGQWAYGENIQGSEVPGGGGGATIETGGAGEPGGPTPPKNDKRGQTRAERQVPVKCDKPIGPPIGDHSNTQFALLGLRACAAAGVVMPKETWTKAQRILEQGQKSDGGWSYTYPSPLDAKGNKTVDAGASYGSMSCSGVCGLIICRFYLGDKSWKGNPAIQSGIDWLGSNFTVTENAKMAQNPAPNIKGGGAAWHYYYLYALERVGMIAGVDKLGGRFWYKNGAKFLLKQQQANGSWSSELGDNTVADTCFAILFLKKATKPLTIQSGK